MRDRTHSRDSVTAFKMVTRVPSDRRDTIAGPDPEAIERMRKLFCMLPHIDPARPVETPIMEQRYDLRTTVIPGGMIDQPWHDERPCLHPRFHAMISAQCCGRGCCDSTSPGSKAAGRDRQRAR